MYGLRQEEELSGIASKMKNASQRDQQKWRYQPSLAAEA